MAKRISAKSASPTPIRFTAKVHRPAPTPDSPSLKFLFLNLPTPASAKLPSRSQVSVQGTINTHPFQATLDPDGQGGHWLKIDAALQSAANLTPNDTVTLEITPLTADQEPEPTVPADLKKALAAAPAKARDAWADITPLARRDWIFWITSGKRAETRPKRIATACDMLAKGKRRACCFDRSGMYSNSLSCPVAEGEGRSGQRRVKPAKA